MAQSHEKQLDLVLARLADVRSELQVVRRVVVALLVLVLLPVALGIVQIVALVIL